MVHLREESPHADVAARTLEGLNCEYESASRVQRWTLPENLRAENPTRNSVACGEPAARQQHCNLSLDLFRVL